MDTSSPLVKLAITAAALYAAYHFGNAIVKTMAIGAAGYIAMNNVPVVRDGLQVRVA